MTVDRPHVAGGVSRTCTHAHANVGSLLKANCQICHHYLISVLVIMFAYVLSVFMCISAGFGGGEWHSDPINGVSNFA